MLCIKIEVIDVTLIDILCSVEFHSVIKIKVHNVFYTHTSIYSKLILSTDGSKYVLQFPGLPYTVI